MRVWWGYMTCSPAVERIIRWRLEPSLESYQNLFPCHRPTATQLSTPHPSIIDWVWFPSIRDKMIELYSHSWVLDQVICELSAHCVVEADVSRILLGVDDRTPRQGYFRIWDLVQTISRNENQLDSLWHCPDPSVDGFLSIRDWTLGPDSPYEIEVDDNEETWTRIYLDDIFRSKKAALRLFKVLRMNDRQRVKLDPAFASKYPELFGDRSVLASGLDCTNRNSAQIPLPRNLTREVIMDYKMMLWKVVN
jgi:hypothetical protein